MNLIFAILSLLSYSRAEPPPQAALSGVWQYVGFELDGQSYPKLDPTLDLRFHFQSEHVLTLRWHYADAENFCESQSIFEIQNGDTLYQKVVWLHPKNNISCSKDPDMQIGKESINPFRLSENRLLLELEMSGKPLIYILEKMSY